MNFQNHSGRDRVAEAMMGRERQQTMRPEPEKPQTTQNQQQPSMPYLGGLLPMLLQLDPRTAGMADDLPAGIGGGSMSGLGGFGILGMGGMNQNRGAPNPQNRNPQGY